MLVTMCLVLFCYATEVCQRNKSFAVVRISFGFYPSSSHLPVLFYFLCYLFTLSSLLVLVISFCCPKIKKAKRRLTVDPIDFEVGCDYSIESRGRSNQVEAGQLTTTVFSPTKLICKPSYKATSVCSFFSLFLFSFFAKHRLLQRDNIILVLSTVIINSLIWPQYTPCIQPSVHACVYRCMSCQLINRILSIEPMKPQWLSFGDHNTL